MKSAFQKLLTVCLLTAACGMIAKPAQAQARVGDICTVQGHAEQTLHGLGLVVGLDGTGDPDKYLPTMQAMATAMSIMGTDVGGIEALKGNRNAALVLVEATIPPDGLMKDSKVTCRVMAAGAAKSLQGGYLIATPLMLSMSPLLDAENLSAYASAAGPLTVSDNNMLAGTIDDGCQMIADWITPIEVNGTIVLNIDPHHSEWGISTEVAEAINVRFPTISQSDVIAEASRQLQVVVRIPASYRNSVPRFIGEIMQYPLASVPKASRVIVDERSGTVVIDPDVEIDSTVFSVQGINVQVGQPGNFSALDPLAGIDDADQFRTAKLQALVDALNAIKVPAEQVISIIRTLDRGGRIHGHVEYIQ